MILLNRAKNLIINGGMDFWQRNTTFNIGTTDTYTADRFVGISNGNTGISVSRDANKPTLAQSNFNFQYSAKVLNPTPGIPAAGIYNTFSQRVEGYLYQAIHAKRAVLSFWVYSTHLGTFPASFRNAGLTRSYVTSFTINAVNTWEKKSISIDMDSDASWLLNAGIGLHVDFCLASSNTHYAPTLNTWLNGNYIAHSSLAQAIQFSAFSMYFTGVQLEEGYEASNFERAGGNYIDELRWCQRYFSKTYNLDVNPGTVTGVGALLTFTNNASSSLIMEKRFPVQMRTTPLVTLYSIATGAANTIRQNIANVDLTRTAVGISEVGYNSLNTSFPSTTDNYYWQHTANAEL